MDINNLALKYYNEKDYAKAIEYFEHIFKSENVPSVEMYAKFSICYKNISKFEESKNILKKGFKNYPKNTWLYLEYALLKFKQEKYEEASEYFKYYYKYRKELYPKENVYKIFLKTVFITNDLNLYEEIAYKAIKTFPDNEIYSVYALHASCLLDIENKDFDKARLKYEAIEAKSKNVTDIHFSKLYLKKLIDIKEKILIDNSKYIFKFSEELKLQLRRRLYSSDILGITEYLKIKMVNLNITGLDKLLELLNDLENIIKITDIPLHIFKSKRYDKVIKDISIFIQNNNFPIELLPSTAWMILFTFCASGKYIKPYYKLRKLSQVSAAYNTSLIDDELLIAQKVRGQAELGIEIYKNDKNYLDSKKFGNMLALLNLYYGDRKSCIDFFSKNLSKEDKDFATYLKDKSIAVVGPVDVGLENGDEIDSFDIVIRFNYRGLDGYNKSKFGTKTHISPYIDEEINNVNNHNLMLNSMQELIYITHQNTSPKNYNIFNNIDTPMKKSFPVWNEKNNPFFRSQPNAIQKVLSDILRFPTGKIKIFNANLWIDDSYNPAYKTTKKGIYPALLIWHDIISNFNFTKILWEKGIFEVDEVLAKVLSMSEEEYAMTMAERYGNDYLLEEDL